MSQTCVTGDRALYIAAKAPRAGVAKTRLGRAIGDEAAVRLYQAFVSDLGARFATAPFQVGWYITPADAWRDLAPLLGPAVADRRVLVQGPGDWTERQSELFRGAAERGEERVVLVASDSPQLTVDIVLEAFRALDWHQLVLGPVWDGGYYLIGMHGWHDVLDGVPMSTATVLNDIRARACAAGLSVGQVEATFDVDEAADLAFLQPLALARGDLSTTRAVLEALDLAGQPALAGGPPPR